MHRLVPLTVKRITREAFDRQNAERGERWVDGWAYLFHGGHYASEHGITGKDVRVGVIDSGFAELSYEFPNIEVQMDFTPTGPGWDELGHGTRVAGIIGAPHDGVGVKGLAPGCKMHIYKVGGRKWPTERALEAIEQALDDRVDVLNMSFGSVETTDSEKKLLHRAIHKGVVSVAAAGNDRDGDGHLYPAKLPSVISVGAFGQYQTGGHHPEYVTYVPTKSACEPDIVAAGVQVPTIHFGDDDSTAPTVGVVSGTSAAAPIVSGLVALIIEMARRHDPNGLIAKRATPRAAQVKAVLNYNAYKPKKGKCYGRGYPNMGEFHSVVHFYNHNPYWKTPA